MSILILNGLTGDVNLTDLTSRRLTLVSTPFNVKAGAALPLDVALMVKPLSKACFCASVRDCACSVIVA